MDERSLDALVATTPQNVTYVCDYLVPSQALMGSTVLAVLPRDADPCLILPKIEVSDLVYNKITWVSDLRPYGAFYVDGKPVDEESTRLLEYLKPIESVDPLKILAQALKEKGLAKARIGIDERGLDKNQYNALISVVNDAQVFDGYELFRQVRMVKTEEEIERLERAAQIAENAIFGVLEIVTEGVRLDDMISKLKEIMLREGAIPDYPSIGISTDNSFTQNIPPPLNGKKLRKGDLIRFDVGCSYKYYHSDIARTAVLGHPSNKQRLYFEAVLNGENNALKAIKPTVKASDIYAIAMQSVKSSGIPHYKRVHTGHGIGLEFYDLPSIAPKCDITMQENMVVNIETPYYEIGFGGVHVEDCGVVTESGHRLFNRTKRELIEISN